MSGGDPLSYTDPRGLNHVPGALAGAGIDAAFGAVGTVVGGICGAVVGGWICWICGIIILGACLAGPAGGDLEGLSERRNRL